MLIGFKSKVEVSQIMLLLIKDKSGRYLVNRFQIHSIQEAYRQKSVSSDIFCRGLTTYWQDKGGEIHIFFKSRRQDYNYIQEGHRGRCN